MSLAIRKMQVKTILISFYTHVDGCNQRETSVGKDVEKLEPAYIAGGNIKWFSCCRKEFHIYFLKKLNIESPFNLAVPPLGIYLREIKAYNHTEICTQMFIATLLK